MHPIRFPIGPLIRRANSSSNSNKRPKERPIKLLNNVPPIGHQNFENPLGHPSGIRTEMNLGAHQSHKKENCQII